MWEWGNSCCKGRKMSDPVVGMTTTGSQGFRAPLTS